MGSPLVVRRTRSEDLAELGTLLDELDALHATNLPWLLRSTDGPRPSSALADFLMAEGRVALVAEAPTVVGLLLAYTRDLPASPILRPARLAEIDTLVVHPSHRRLGAGRALVNGAVEWARASGAVRVELGVYEFNAAARAFWQTLGFETLSRRVHRTVDSAG